MVSKKVNDLRKEYPRFIYQGFAVKRVRDDLKISFSFKIEPDIYFAPEITIKNVNQSRINNLDGATLNNLAFHLGLMEIPSYWKATCSPEIIIEAGFLTKKQMLWWKNLLLNGLGQFFYTNKVDFVKPDFVTFKTEKKSPFSPFPGKLNPNKILVPIGGGKDSVTALEILKKSGLEINCLSLNSTPAATKIMESPRAEPVVPFVTSLRDDIRRSRAPSASQPWRSRTPTGRARGALRRWMELGGCNQPIIVKREIDPALLKLNQEGYLNGHTPFSAYIAFLSIACALLFDFGKIAVSNERSANEENLVFLGRKVNHQYSKSFHFEKVFTSYIEKYLAKDVRFFSFLRPLYEIQICRLFSQYPQYFSIFKSCNKGQSVKTILPFGPEKKNIWCCNCAKCLSVFICLYPFVKEKDLIKIFGQNLFEKENLWPIILSLIGEKGRKPFECVGTKEEILVGLYLSLEKAEQPLPYILLKFKSEILPKHPNLNNLSQKILNSWNKEHYLPADLEEILKKNLFQGQP